MSATPNPIRKDGYVLQHFVPVPSLDTPEEILEYYRQWWVMCMVRAARLRVNHAMFESQYFHASKDEDDAKREFDIANSIVESYRFACGQGTLVSVVGRQGGHKIPEFQREIPLTHPGTIHFWNEDKKHNILCEDDAHAYESAVEYISYVTCPHCLALYWQGKRSRKARYKRRKEILS